MNESMTLLGEIIGQAVVDYLKPITRKKGHERKEEFKIRREAKHFLFSDRLDNFLDKYNLSDSVSSEYIRNTTRKIAKNRKEKTKFLNSLFSLERTKHNADSEGC